jgi:hypothetical protein
MDSNRAVAVNHQLATQAKTLEEFPQRDATITKPALARPPAHSLLRLQRAIGNQAVQRYVQATLSVGAADDEYEQEASQVVAQVMSNARGSVLLQRKCQCGGSADSHGECAECRKRRLSIQRKVGDSPFGDQPDRSAPPAVYKALRSPSQPLDAATRSFLESQFDADFAEVRIHTDHTAAEAAQEIQARAFTSRQDIVFASGQFAPESDEGKRLLVHELTHTIQQRDGSLSPRPSHAIQRSPDTDGPSIWDTISQGARDAGSAIIGGATSVGTAVIEGVRDVGGSILQDAEAAGARIAQGVKSAAGSVVQTVASVGSDLVALEEKIASVSALLKDYSPLPGGLIRLKNEMIAEKARLLALGESMKEGTAPLPGPVVTQVPPVGGGSGGAGEADIGPSAGGCGLCYGQEEGKVGPREAGTAAHRVIQNIMIANPGLVAELPLGSGRVDLAVVRHDLKQIEIGEIKPANLKGIEAGINQIETRLRVLPTLAQYSDYTAVPLKYPVRQPIRFETGAPFCIEQPGFCFSQDLSVAGPVGGLYLYFCEPSYSELLSGGCHCKCKEPPPFPFPIPAEKREKERPPRRVVNWDKVATVVAIIALLVALVAAVICMFPAAASGIGIPVALVCGLAAAASGAAMLALLVKFRKEPDTTA